MSKGKSVAKIWTSEIPTCYRCGSDNVFYVNKEEIANISRKYNVDISGATTIFRHKYATVSPRVCDEDEYNAWMGLLNHYIHYGTLRQLFG